VIALVVGAPGAGKSYYCVSEILDALEAGKYVATNVELMPGWALAMAKSNFLRRLVPGRVRKTAADYERRLHVTHDLDELFRLRLQPCGSCGGCKRGARCSKEGRGRMILDEAHNWMNSRNWRDGDRDVIVRFFTQHRKLGWDVYLISQDENNLDRQVRTLYEYLVKLRNLRRYKVLGIPIVPFNFFLAIWTWNDRSGSIVKRQGRRLRRKIARLYDTMATSHGLDDDVDTIMFPPSPVDAAEQLRQEQDLDEAGRGELVAATPSDTDPV
jgi:hypothetical protein